MNTVNLCEFARRQPDFGAWRIRFVIVRVVGEVDDYDDYLGYRARLMEFL